MPPELWPQAKVQMQAPFYTALNFSSPSIDDLFKSLNSSPNGLSQDEVRKLQNLSRRKTKPSGRFRKKLKLFIRQFTNPLILILIVVVILSIILQQRSDVFIITVIILLTGVLGFIQELNAGQASEKLLAMIRVKHTVMREGKTTELGGEEILSGDVLLFDAGDIIPADCRIIESNELHVNESSLTGESFRQKNPTGNFRKILP